MNFKLTILLLSAFCLSEISGQYTKKDSNILSRKKRYLMFPKGSNFVFQVVFVKVLMKKVPKGVQYLTEFDFPYPLPSDTTLFSKFKHGHQIHKRQLFDDISQAFDRYGLNGTECVKRVVCDAQEFMQYRRKSLVRDLLYTAFSNSGLEQEAEVDLSQDWCQGAKVACPHPFLDMIFTTLTDR